MLKAIGSSLNVNNQFQTPLTMSVRGSASNHRQIRTSNSLETPQALRPEVKN